MVEEEKVIEVVSRDFVDIKYNIKLIKMKTQYKVELNEVLRKDKLLLTNKEEWKPLDVFTLKTKPNNDKLIEILDEYIWNVRYNVYRWLGIEIYSYEEINNKNNN